MSASRDIHLTEAAVLAVVGRPDELGSALRSALADGVAEADLREMLVQVIPYAGYPRGLTALRALARVRGTPVTDDVPPTLDSGALRTRGEATFRAVYGDRADSILERIGAWHPELPDWLLTEPYGRVLARPELPLVDREVLAAALLTALDQPDQLQGHLRGGLRAGAAPERLRAAVETAARHVPADVADRARERLRLEVPNP